jgi:hypothetical protein
VNSDIVKHYFKPISSEKLKEMSKNDREECVGLDEVNIDKSIVNEIAPTHRHTVSLKKQWD